MSIYATVLIIADERQWIASLQADGIDAGVIRDGEPEPDDLDAPIIYQGSHILPSEDDPRGGNVDLALIPSHITRDGRDDKPEDEAPWPFLRVDVDEHEGAQATVILTVRQVTRLRDSLSEWLEAVAVCSCPPDTPARLIVDQAYCNVCNKKVMPRRELNG